MNLTDFLLARIAEDEAVARQVQKKVDDGPSPLGYFEDAEGSSASAYFDRDYHQGGYTITAARVLAECEAKRRVVSNAITLNNQADAMGDDEPNHASFRGQALAWRVALRFLALPYADHPDYRDEWRP